MSLRELKLTDLQANACGKWSYPNGVEFFPVPFTIPVYETLQADQAIVPDYEVATHSEYDFLVRVISYTGLTPGTLIQIQWPDGRYLSNAGVDVFSFYGTGKRGRLLEVPKLLPPNTKIRLTLDNSAVGSISNVELFFEGVLKVPFINGKVGG